MHWMPGFDTVLTIRMSLLRDLYQRSDRFNGVCDCSDPQQCENQYQGPIKGAQFFPSLVLHAHCLIEFGRCSDCRNRVRSHM